jgi:5-(carboxyamino)imidazole ribonucleotide mutase
MKKVAIIMGSETDYAVMEKAAEALREFKIPFHMEVVSAHRTPDQMFDFAKSAHSKGYGVIIAGAGGAAHLPGMVASLTTLPVIGVPIQVGKLQGLDALLSIAQMPKGIPVATVAVDNGANAGLLAARILGIQNEKITAKLKKFQKAQSLKVKIMNRNIKKKN